MMADSLEDTLSEVLRQKNQVVVTRSARGPRPRQRHLGQDGPLPAHPCTPARRPCASLGDGGPSSDVTPCVVPRRLRPHGLARPLRPGLHGGATVEEHGGGAGQCGNGIGVSALSGSPPRPVPARGAFLWSCLLVGNLEFVL